MNKIKPHLGKNFQQANSYSQGKLPGEHKNDDRRVIVAQVRQEIAFKTERFLVSYCKNTIPYTRDKTLDTILQIGQFRLQSMSLV